MLWSIEAAMSKVCGELIAIAHSDDAWVPTKLEKQVEYLDSHPNEDACFTRVSVIDDDNCPIAGNPYYENHPYLTAFEQINRSRQDWLRFFFPGQCVMSPSVLIRRHC